MAVPERCRDSSVSCNRLLLLWLGWALPVAWAASVVSSFKAVCVFVISKIKKSQIGLLWYNVSMQSGFGQPQPSRRSHQLSLIKGRHLSTGPGSFSDQSDHAPGDAGMFEAVQDIRNRQEGPISASARDCVGIVSSLATPEKAVFSERPWPAVSRFCLAKSEGWGTLVRPADVIGWNFDLPPAPVSFLLERSPVLHGCRGIRPADVDWWDVVLSPHPSYSSFQQRRPPRHLPWRNSGHDLGSRDPLCPWTWRDMCKGRHRTRVLLQAAPPFFGGDAVPAPRLSAR
jgi:hypothetical protein